MYFILQIASPKSWLYLGLDKKFYLSTSPGREYVLHKEVLEREFATSSCK